MKRTADPELDRFILDHLVEKYKLKQPRDSIHLSTLVYCLTKGFFDRRFQIQPTDEEVMLFALGLGLQDVLTPAVAETPVFEMDGVTFSPDFYLPFGSHYCELKTTRMSSKKAAESLPEAWLEYIQGGCYMRGVATYKLSVLFMMGNYAPPFPNLHSETLEFTDEELKENWDRLMIRKEIFQRALQLQKPPKPYDFAKDWECKNCRHSLVCDAIASTSAENIRLNTVTRGAE